MFTSLHLPKRVLYNSLLLILIAISNCFGFSNHTDSELDPVQFKFYANKSEVAVGEEFEITIVVYRQKGWDSRFNQSILGDDYRIKVVFPAEFEQSRGNYSDFASGKVKDNVETEYKIVGRYNSKPTVGNSFTLLRGTENSIELNRFLFKGELSVAVFDAQSNSASNKRTTDSNCSFTEGQYLATFAVTTEQVFAHYCGSVLYATTSPGAGGVFKPKTWLQAIGYANAACFADAQPNLSNCASGGCTTPATPTISKTGGSTVCSNANQSVTLSASGNVTWFKDNVQVGTGSTYQTTVAGTYTAKSASGTCVSASSNVIVVTENTTCNGRVTDTPISCSGYTFTHHQVIGSVWQGNVEVRIEGNCAVAYWADGGVATGRTNKNWLVNLGGKKIPDSVLGSCLKWEGEPLDCAGKTENAGCTTPSAPTISKSAGTTVCSITNQSVTLSASGCSGNITWFKDNVQVGTGSTYQATTAGSYTAKCTSGTCVSVASNTIVVTQTSGCGAVANSNNCSFTEGQYLATFAATTEQVFAHYCGSVLYATTSAGAGGVFKPKTWLQAIGYAHASCFADAQPNLSNCTSGGCTTPATPTISKTAGTTVCANANQSVTLSASGNVTWFKDNVQVGTGSTYQTTVAGSYTAKSASGTCVSASSNVIVVTENSACNAPAGNNTSCSGYTFTHHQVIGSVWQGNVEVRIEGNCAVVYWADGGVATGRTNKNWLANLGGKKIPDSVLGSCLKWEGESVDCASKTENAGCTPPAAPTINKTAGSTVCANTNQSVTLSASGCSGNLTWYKDNVQVGSGNTYQTTAPGSYTAKCTSGTCVSVASNTIIVAETSGCGAVVNSSVLGAYTKVAGNREFTYNRTPVLELQFNPDGTITDATPGIQFDGTTNKIGNKRVFYMIGYSVFGNTQPNGNKVYHSFKNVYLPDGIYSIRQFIVDPSVCANITEFTQKLNGWNNGVNYRNAQLSEINLSVRTLSGGSVTSVPSWLKVSRGQQLSNAGFNFPADGTFSAYNIKSGVKPSAYQALGVNTELLFNNDNAQPNTWKVFKWAVDHAKPSRQELYENGRNISKLFGINKNTVVSDEYPENTQGQDPEIDVKMNEFYRGVLDHIKLTNPGINKNQTNLYGSYGMDDYNKLIDKDMLKGDRQHFEQSLTSHVHKKYDPSTQEWGGDVVYYTAGDINVRNVNTSYYMYNDVRMIPYELCYVNERVKVGTKTYQNQDRESKWIALSWGSVETLVRDDNNQVIGVELNRTGDIIPYKNGEVLAKFNTPIAAVWDEYFPLGFYSTWIGNGIALWGGGTIGEDATKINYPAHGNQPMKWTSTGGSQMDYISGKNGAPVNSTEGLSSTLHTSPIDAAYAGWKLAKSIKGRSQKISHSSYTSSLGSFNAVAGQTGLHLNGFGPLNKSLFVVKDAYDQKKGLALVGQGPEGNIAVYYNGFLSQHEFEDNVTIQFGGQSINIGRVYGRQIVTKSF
jgi:hypothetical protein